ncbi:hypothetical protein ACIBH1_45515 [Nonomuraea sp. NPDC050663]|uniref:hypothetical protein n=1 Tax=Nonomuraea sp. NPDC050663 TaxID=3364370 RepID=UPI00379B21BD
MSDLFGDRAEMTDMKWARSEQGRRAIPDDELAMMAYTVGIEPEQLAAVDQGAAAELLAGLLQKYPRPDPEQVDPDQPARDALYEALSGLTHESVRAELEREIRQIRNLRGIPEEEREKAIQFLLAQVRLAIQQSHNTVNLLKSR